MIDRDSNHKKSNWRLALAVVVLALLACAFLIHLAREKVAVEEKIEEKFWPDGPAPRPTPYFRPLDESDN